MFKTSKGKLSLFALVIIGLSFLFAYHVDQTFTHPQIWWGVWIGFIGYAFMTVASWCNKQYAPHMLPDKTVAIVIPVYNEDPDALLECLDSLLAQTRPANRIYIIDDASENDAIFKLASAYSRLYYDANIRVMKLGKNAGKRHSQFQAFKDFDADIWVTIDSDTKLASDAIENLIGPFAVDDEIQAVSGRIVGWNWNESWLTRLVDVELATAFATGKSAASALNALVVASGGLAAYRGSLIRDNLDEYLNETFRGRPVTAGDDRSLTQYGLRIGKTVYQESALAWTLLPTTSSHLMRQRIRWMASWYRGTLWCVRHLPMGWGLIMVVQQALGFVTSLVLLPLMIVGMIFRPEVMLWLGFYFTALTIIRALRLVSLSRPDISRGRYLLSVCLSPVVTFGYFFGGVPLRLYSLRYVFSRHWGTREEVEVIA
jgi:hyaluronan synthase